MGGCCENAGPNGWCKRHRRENEERRLTYNAALPLGEHRCGGIFTPDGTGGGTLRWAEVVRWDPVHADGTPDPDRKEGEAGYLQPVLVMHEVRKEPFRG